METRNTPLVRLGSLSDKTGCEILAKAEWMNPGGSVKDRAAKYLVSDAEKKGALTPGGTVVEGTAGNTGIGLAHMCRARGYKCIIYIPETQSKEKMDALRYVRFSSVEGYMFGVVMVWCDSRRRPDSPVCRPSYESCVGYSSALFF